MKQKFQAAFLPFFLFFGIFGATAQVAVPFTQRTSQYTPTKKIYNVKGDFTMMGNTNLTLQNYTESGLNNNNTMVYVDVDGDVNTLNSSSANLNFSTENGAVPSCSNIVYAGLYWTGRTTADGQGPSANTFTVSKDFVNGSQTVNTTNVFGHAQAITNTAYNLNITRTNLSETNRSPNYIFAGSGNSYVFKYSNQTGLNMVTLSVNGAAAVNIPVTVSVSGTTATATLTTPYVVNLGTATMTISQLIRSTSTILSDADTKATAKARVNVNGVVPTYQTITKNYDKRVISLKGPNASSYTQFTAGTNDIYYPQTSDQFIYSAYTEVTDYVRQNGIGTYFAADIALVEGNGGGTGYSGGWGLVVVYENSKMKYRDVTIFDGHAFVLASTTATAYDLPVSGFNTVQAGNVGVKLGLISSEGDRTLTGDFFQIRKNSDNTLLSLNHSLNSPNNYFNSSINTGNVRNPSLLNNTGMDISMFDVPNQNNSVIGNSQTSTNFRYGTSGDTYAIFAIAMAVDAYVPDAEGILSAVSIDGVPTTAGNLTALPGQELKYKIQIRNKGTEAINNFKVTVPVPYNTTYVAGSATNTVLFTPAPTPNAVSFQPTVGANGSVVWDFGTLPLAANPETLLGEITFKFKVTEDCALLQNTSCSNVVSVNGALSGIGAVTAISLANKPVILGYNTTGACQGNEIPAPVLITINAEDFISQNCSGNPPVTAFTFCDTGESIAITEVSGSFPPGTTFYNSYPVVSGTTIQYTINNPFPATPGTSTYYAVPPGATNGCFFQFTITVTTITTVPAVQDISYCVGNEAVPLTGTPSVEGYTLYYYDSLNGTAQLSITPSTAVAGTFTFYVSEGQTATCIGPKQPIVVTVFELPSAPVTSEPGQPTCELSSGSVVLSGLPSGNWTITQSGTFSNIFTGTGTTFTVSGLTEGSYTFTVSNAGECTSSASATVAIDAVPNAAIAPIIGTITQPTCDIPTGSVILSGLPEGNWTINQSGTSSNSYSGTGSNFTVTSLATGTYTFSVTNEANCTSPASLAVEILPVPVLPTAPLTGIPDQPTCANPTGSVVLSGLPQGTWTVNQTGPISNSYTGVGETFTVSGLISGIYSFSVTNDNGCTSFASLEVIINVAPVVPNAPITSEITQPTCALPFGSIVLSGLPEGNWTINQSGTVTNTYSGSGSTFTVNNLAEGSYNFSVTNAAECTSVNSLSVIINASPVNPTAPLTSEITQPTCQIPNGSVLITGLPQGNWTINQAGTASNTYTGSGTSFTVTGLTEGIYTFTVTNESGCISLASAEVTIDVVPVAPTSPVIAEVIQATCFAPASVILSGLPEGSWTVNQTGTSAATYTGTGSVFTIIPLATGSYSFSVSITDGCSSAPSEIVQINEAPIVPEIVLASVTAQPTCQSLTGTILITGLPVGTWTINQSGTSENTYTGTGSSFTITNVAPGTYTFNVSTAAGCNSAESETVTIIAAPVVPNALTLVATQPTCELSSGSVLITGLPEGQWTINQSGTVANTYTGTGSDFTVSEISSGTYTFSVTNIAGCTSQVSESITIIPQPATPEAPISGGDQTECATTPIQTLTATATVAAGQTIVWYDALTGGNIVANPTLSTVGTITYYAESTSGNCVSATRTAVTLTINAAAVAPVLADIIGECAVNVPTPIADGLCGSLLTATTSDPVTYSSPGTYIVQWNFSDASGNLIFTVIQNVIVTDTTAPIIPVLADITGECFVTVPTPLTNDNCAGQISGTTADPLQYSGVGAYIVTWNFSDGNGNNVSVNQNVFVVDVTAPLVPVLADVTGQCSACAEAPVTSDNCTNTPIIGTTNDEVCYTVPGTYVITWSFDDGHNNISTTTQNVIVTGFGTPVEVSIYAECNADNAVERNINLNEFLPLGTVPGGTWTSTELSSQNLNGSVFTPYLLEVRDYLITYTISNGDPCTPVIVARISVDDKCEALPTGDCVPFVHNAFSPNNDGVNDVLIIDQLEDTTCVPENQVEIFNRWGVLVFETRQYNNNERAFKGYSDGRVTVDKSSELPSGTYFYIIRYTNDTGNHADQGYIYMTR